MSLWGKNDTDLSVPKYLTEAQKPFAIFIDALEAKDPANQAKGLTSAGWWLYRETTDSSGNIRHRSEHLVSMRSPVHDSGTGIRETIEASIDQITTYVLSFATKPSNQSVSAPAPAKFTSSVVSNPTGEIVSYQWLMLDTPSKTYIPVTNTGVYTGSTTNTLHISDSTDLNGTVYKVVASAQSAVSVTSVSVKLTVA